MQIIDYKTKKYNLLKILHKMSVERYRYVLNHLPGKLSISNSLFRKWLYLDAGETYEIDYHYLKQISQLLNVSTEDLINFTPPKQKPIIVDNYKFPLPPPQIAILEPKKVKN